MTNEFRQLLLNLALVMGGNSQVFDAHGSPNREDRPLADPFRGGPAVDPLMDPAWWRKQWDHCHFPDQRERLTEELRNHLASCRYARRTNREDRGTLPWKVEIATREGPVKETAHLYGVSVQTIYNYRADDKVKRAIWLLQKVAS